MPNIIEDLRRIMNARYGREVRQSIHDAISDINDVADNAESVAITSQESAQNNATKAESFAVGGTGSRTGEDRDNAKFYKEEAERLAGVYAVEDNLTSTSTIHSLSANQGRILNGKITDIEDSVGSANGIASLDANGRVPSTQLPSYVDDVLEYASVSNFPATGESGKIYIALDTNKTYRWGGSAYVEISESLALGETSSTAYAGDKGKANADNISALTSRVDSVEGSLEGGTTGQVLAKNSNDDLDFTWQTLSITPAAIIDLIHPVGSVITTTNSANPSTYWTGTTWVRKAKGRVLVGVDENDTAFDTVGETGGSSSVTLTESQIPSHRHTIPSLSGNTSSDGSHRHNEGWALAGGGNSARGTGGNFSTGQGEVTDYAGSHSHTVTTTASNTGYTGGNASSVTQPVNNLQPYETVYFWERTA